MAEEHAVVNGGQADLDCGGRRAIPWDFDLPDSQELHFDLHPSLSNSTIPGGFCDMTTVIESKS